MTITAAQKIELHRRYSQYMNYEAVTLGYDFKRGERYRREFEEYADSLGLRFKEAGELVWETIAKYKAIEQEAAADARLIAAAPDLLESLKDAVSGGDWDINRAKAAIAKATGGAV
jgi:hypothetical protein